MITAHSNRAERRAEAARKGTPMMRGAQRPVLNPMRQIGRRLYAMARAQGVRVRKRGPALRMILSASNGGAA